MIEQEDNSNIEWNIGDKVDSVGRKFKNGEVIGIKDEGSMIILEIKWPNGIIQERSERIVRKVE